MNLVPFVIGHVNRMTFIRYWIMNNGLRPGLCFLSDSEIVETCLPSLDSLTY